MDWFWISSNYTDHFNKHKKVISWNLALLSQFLTDPMANDQASILVYSDISYVDLCSIVCRYLVINWKIIYKIFNHSGPQTPVFYDTNGPESFFQRQSPLHPHLSLSISLAGSWARWVRQWLSWEKNLLTWGACQPLMKRGHTLALKTF